jgi:PPK2 family polyphosphate:nucleotide phosphotransferase
MEPHLRFVKDLVTPLLVAPGRTVKLARDFDAGHTAGLTSQAEAQVEMAEGAALLAEYQERLAAQETATVVLVLQGLDASGKDGTIKHVMSGVNPQGVEVHSFKQPSVEELHHDFLWRYQRALPERGRVGIFNRSHYEEVLVVRVHPELLGAERLSEGQKSDVWKGRFRAINEWEQYLSDNGVHMVKVFLNLSKHEQAKRFLERIDNPEKNWKFSVNDIHERRYWDLYQEAFSAMLSHTSTRAAPWYVVPADHKWFARLATAAVLINTLVDIDPQYPKVDPEMLRQMAETKTELMAERPHPVGG